MNIISKYRKIKPKVLVINCQHRKEGNSRIMIPVLLVAVSMSFTSGLWATSTLHSEDKVTTYKGLLLSVFGAIFFTTLYTLINNVMQRTGFGQKLVKKYKLTTSDVLDASNKVVSGVQAVLSCLTGLIVICYSCPRNLLKTSHHMSEAYAWFGASYFMYDIWSMYQVHYHATGISNNNQQNGDFKKKKQDSYRFLRYVKSNPIIVGHHLFIGLFGFSVIVYLRGGLGDCVFGYVYLMEASTPFVSIRSILSRMNMKNSKTYVLNGLLMLIVFFLCRIAMFPYVMYLYATAANLDYISAIMSLPRGCKATMSVLVLPQIYWFYLMMRGATKIVRFKITNSTTTNYKKKKNNNYTS